MPPPPPAEPQPNPNIPVIKTREPAPTFAGTVRFLAFADLAIVTGDKEKKDGGSMVDMAKVESSVKRVKGVTSFSYEVTSREISVGFTGPVSEVKDIKIAIDNQSLSNEVLSPARIVIRPIGKVDKPEGVLGSIKGVSGVVAAEQDFNDWVAYGDLSVLSLEALIKACEGSGAKCQIVSHEEIKVKHTGTGATDALKNELSRTKWVLKVDIVGGEVRVVTVKGRVTKAQVKATMSKLGFPEAQ